MALAPIRIPKLQQREPIVDSEGRMSIEFSRKLNDVLDSLGVTVNALANIPQIQAALESLDEATQAAKDAAADATASTAANQREAALQGSYIEPASVLSATPTTITIAAHTRRYADGTSAAVNGGTVPSTGAGDTDYVSYNDTTRAGGAVTYIVSTTPPTQTGDTHVVGAVMIPATGTADGGEGPRRPGYVVARGNEVEP